MANILVVDDIAGNRELLTTLLGYLGHQLFEAADGIEALAQARAHALDLVITDILMPTMDGYEFVRELRADPATRAIPVIFYSATYLEREMEGLAKLAGVHYTLTKPVEPQQVLDVVAQALAAPAEATNIEPPAEFDREHLRVVSSKLSEKAAELTAANARLTGLLELNHEMAQQREAQLLLQRFCVPARKLIGARLAGVGLAAPDGQRLQRFVSSRSQAASPIPPAPIPSDAVELILRARKLVHSRDIGASAAQTMESHGSGYAFLGGPLQTASALYGVWFFGGKIGLPDFSAEDEQIAQTMGAQLAVAYENLRRYDEIRGYSQSLESEIAERTHAEQALQASERRFRALIEHSADGITLLGADGAIVYRSPANARIRGYPDVEAIDLNGVEAVHPEDRAQFIAALKQLRQQPGASTDLVLRIEHRSGSWRWAEGTVTNLLEEPSVRALVVNYRDVTERLRAQEALQRSEGRYRQLIETSQEGIGVIDAAGRTTLANPRILEMIGYTSEEVLDRNLFEFIAAEDHAAVGAALEQLRTRPNVQAEFRFRRRDGGIVWVLAQASPLFDSQRDGAYSGALAMFTDISERKRTDQVIQRQLNHLTALRAIDRSITGSFDLRLSLEIIVAQVAGELEVDAVGVLLLPPSATELSLAAARGYRSRRPERGPIRVGEGLVGRVALEHRVYTVEDIKSNPFIVDHRGLLAAEGFVAYAGAPLISKGKVLGVLEIFHRSPLAFEPEWLEFFEALAGQAAIAVDNAQLFEGLQQSNMGLRQSYESTLEGWSRALDLRDKETEGHTQRVTDLTMRLAETIGFGGEELMRIRRGALLHDIGKMGVPDSVLLKPGPLTAEEWTLMKRHPELAFQLLSPIEYLRASLDIPYCHHEKWDGTGYPRGLKGEQIPPAARIFAVVDVWDALRSDRPYRKAWPEEQVRAHVQSLSGTHFEPRIVDAFMKLV